MTFNANMRRRTNIDAPRHTDAMAHRKPDTRLDDKSRTQRYRRLEVVEATILEDTAVNGLLGQPARGCSAVQQWDFARTGGAEGESEVIVSPHRPSDLVDGRFAGELVGRVGGRAPRTCSIVSFTLWAKCHRAPGCS